MILRLVNQVCSAIQSDWIEQISNVFKRAIRYWPANVQDITLSAQVFAIQNRPEGRRCAKM
jgi:hypothetical protein